MNQKISAPQVSIITPTYNHASYIGQCIVSVQSQTFEDWEMIIIDDGSTDTTGDIVKTFAAHDPRITYIRQDNVGIFRLAETYNKALGIANGKYIAVLEGDDLWLPEKIKKQVEQLEQRPNAVLCWSKARLVSWDEQIEYKTSPVYFPEHQALYQNSPNGSIIELFLYKQWIPALTLMIRRTALNKIGGFLHSYNMPLVDLPTILRLSLEGDFIFMDEVTGKWRMYPTQTTKTYTTNIYLGAKELVKAHTPMVYAHRPEMVNTLLNHFDGLCLVAYARSGRYRLIRKEFPEARLDYRKAIFYPVRGHFLWRLRSVIGYFLSLLKLDVEWLAKLLGKKTYRPSNT